MKLLTLILISITISLVATRYHRANRNKGQVDGCWKDAEDRGEGEVLSCPPKMDNEEGICYDKCNTGEKGVGLLCWKEGKSRERAKRPVFWCRDGLEKSNSICYPSCKTGLNGIGPVCWGTCPSGYNDCGAACLKTSCSGSIRDSLIAAINTVSKFAHGHKEGAAIDVLKKVDNDLGLGKCKSKRKKLF